MPELTIIKPQRGWIPVDFKELWKYRELFAFLIWRDIKIRYKQTVLGGLWAVIQPFLAMVVFTLFFGKLAKMPSDGIPYPIFSYTAMIAWTYFANAIAGSGNSLVSNTNMISKVYFPRIIVPVAPCLAGLLDFTISFVVLIGMMLYFHVYPTAMIVILPLLVFLILLTASGIGMILSALNVRYRDIKYTIPFLIQLWMFASPIVYPASMVPEKYRLLYSLNPMAGVIEGFRSVLLGTVAFPATMVAVSVGMSSLIFLVGLFYFKQMERYFADII
jgi:lipopolysaccharide transport system permease protein